VNYDVIGSPIRAIQRAGRTGRKREGRVVCLISEGQEEQKYRKKLDAERTLVNALRNPKRFKMASHFPMLPHHPVREFRSMNVQSQLHLSQVAGAHRTPGATNRGKTKGRKNDNSWRVNNKGHWDATWPS